MQDKTLEDTTNHWSRRPWGTSHFWSLVLTQKTILILSYFSIVMDDVWFRDGGADAEQRHSWRQLR